MSSLYRYNLIQMIEAVIKNQPTRLEIKPGTNLVGTALSNPSKIGSGPFADLRFKHYSVDLAHAIISKRKLSPPIRNQSYGALEVDFERRSAMLMDLESDKGTYKETTAGKQCLKPKEGFEYDFGDLKEAAFFVGDVKFKINTDVVQHTVNNNHHPPVAEEEQKNSYSNGTKNNNISNVDADTLEAETLVFPGEGRQSANHEEPSSERSANLKDTNSNSILNDATLVMPVKEFAPPQARKVEANNFLLPPPKKMAKEQAVGIGDATQMIAADANFGSTMVFSNDFGRPLYGLSEQPPDATLIFNRDNVEVLDGPTQIIGNSPGTDIDATMVVPNDSEIKMKNNAHGKRGAVLFSLKEESDEESSGSVIHPIQKIDTGGSARKVNESLDAVIREFDDGSQERPRKNTLDELLGEESDDCLEKRSMPQSMTQDSRRKYTKVKQEKMSIEDKKPEAARPSQISHSIDRIIESDSDEPPREKPGRRPYAKRKVNETSILSSEPDLGSQKDGAGANKRVKRDDAENSQKSKIVPLRASSRGGRRRFIEDLSDGEPASGKHEERKEPAFIIGGKSNEIGDSPSVLITGKAKEPKFAKIVKNLGGTAVEEIDRDFDIMVADKLIRNAKLLIAITRGVPVVSLKWLMDSDKKNKFLPHEPFLLKDPPFEKQHSCNMIRLYGNKECASFLKDQVFFISGNLQTIQIETLSKIIEGAGGSLAKKKDKAKVWIMDETKDKASLKKLPPNVKACSVELVFEGILRQRLDFEKHSLISQFVQ